MKTTRKARFSSSAMLVAWMPAMRSLHGIGQRISCNFEEDGGARRNGNERMHGYAHGQKGHG